jgi:D-sedoheptulose 7-phosphate isomerase
MYTFNTFLTNYVGATQKWLTTIELGRIAELYSRIQSCQGTVWVVGNGGSASLAEHWAQDLQKQCRVRAQALTNLASITAYANDVSYEQVFSRQLSTLAKEGDLLVAISGSGNSPNVLAALTMARRMGVETFGVLGMEGGQAKDLCEGSIIVPGDPTDEAGMGHAENGHVWVLHAVVYGMMAKPQPMEED